MRKLLFVVRSRSGTLPIIVAASVIPASACGSKSGLLGPEDTNVDASAGGKTGGGGGTSAIGGGINVGGTGGGINLGGTGGAGFGGFGGSGGTNTDFCDQPSYTEAFTVPFPSEGVPADPGTICSVSVEPVESGHAARVTLQKLGAVGDLQLANGFCEIPPALEPRVVGLPTIEVIDTSHPELSSMTVSNVTKVAGGYSFQAAFSQPLKFKADGFARLTVRTSLELDCAPQPFTRVVHAATDIHVCLGEGDEQWVSSGDNCTVCRIIAEMAPSPIVPDKPSDELPLARAMRLRIVELARVSNTLILLAEHDGGEGLDYEWHASDGVVEKLAPDVIAWTLQEGMTAPFIQAAVSGSAAVAVASYGFNEAA